MLLKIKIAELMTVAAQKNLLDRIRLEETMTDEVAVLDPKPTGAAFYSALQNCEKSEYLLRILRKTKSPYRWEQSRIRRDAIASHASLAVSPEDLGALIQEIGYECLQSAKPEVVREWAAKKPALHARDSEEFSKLQYTTGAECLSLMARVEDDRYRSYERMINLFKDKLTAADKATAVRLLCDSKRKLALDVGSLDRLQQYPRKLVDNRLVIELPTPETYTYEKLMEEL